MGVASMFFSMPVTLFFPWDLEGSRIGVSVVSWESKNLLTKSCFDSSGSLILTLSLSASIPTLSLSPDSVIYAASFSFNLSFFKFILHLQLFHCMLMLSLHPCKLVFLVHDFKFCLKGLL